MAIGEVAQNESMVLSPINWYDPAHVSNSVVDMGAINNVNYINRAGQETNGALSVYQDIINNKIWVRVTNLGLIADFPDLQMFQTLFETKAWNWGNFSTDFAQYVDALTLENKVKLHDILSSWSNGDNGLAQFNNFRDDLLNGTEEFRNFMFEDMDRVRAWEVLNFDESLRNNLDFLRSLENIHARVELNGQTSWVALKQVYEGLLDQQKITLTEELKFADELYDNGDEFYFSFLLSPEQSPSLKPFLTGSDLRGIGRPEPNPGLVLTQTYGAGLPAEEFYQKSISMINQYIDPNRSSHAFLFGLDPAIYPASNYFPQQHGILDIHVHGDLDAADGLYKFWVSDNKTNFIGPGNRGVWIGAEEMADIIMSSSEFEDTNAIRLFACWGEQSGAQEIASITGKPVLGANYIINVTDYGANIGDMSLSYGKLELYVPQN